MSGSRYLGPSEELSRNHHVLSGAGTKFVSAHAYAHLQKVWHQVVRNGGCPARLACTPHENNAVWAAGAGAETVADEVATKRRGRPCTGIQGRQQAPCRGERMPNRRGEPATRAQEVGCDRVQPRTMQWVQRTLRTVPTAPE